MLKNTFRAQTLKDSNQEGFTLIELVIVVAVIGILTAIAIPSYGAIQDAARQNSLDTTIKNIITEYQAVDAETGITKEKATAIADRYYYGGVPTPDYYKEGANIVSYLTADGACTVSVWINGSTQTAALTDISNFFSYSSGSESMAESPIKWSAIYYGPLASPSNESITKVTADNFRDLNCHVFNG